nr:hypothetical protein [Alaria marginata]UAX22228.1 hypothetical protein [Alaria marginata]WKZ04804.1 hypothetical protein [Alaria marginata]WKZ04945.1 hypothetical protein [Alaria marginata]WKZ05086.1 hypothetical protein [Alaria marginata]
MTNLNFVPKNVPNDLNVSSRVSNEINDSDKNLFDNNVNVNNLWSEENENFDRWGINDGSEKTDKPGNLNESNKKIKLTGEKDVNQNLAAKEKLNKVQVYFIVKSIKGEGKEALVAVPINNFDDLSNSSYGKAISARAGTFLMRTDADLNKKGFIEGKPGNRPFILEHALEVEAPYGSLPELPLEALVLAKKYGINGNLEVQDLTIEEQEEDESKLITEMIVDDSGKERMLYYFLSEYEYDYAFLDNTIFTNVEPYLTTPRDEVSFNRTFKDILENNIKTIGLDDIWNKEKKELRLSEIEDLVYKNTDELLSKNIIPIFSDLEEAQDLLIIVLEELLEPFKTIRFIENSSNQDDYPLTNIDYFDDSFTLQNKYASPETRMDKIQLWLTKYRLIKSRTQLKPQYELNYQRFLFPRIPEELHEFLEPDERSETAYLSESDTVLLDIASNVKIVSMGLGDFLSFWNNSETKNGEILFIPSSKSFKKINLPLISKKPKDRFYEYQQKFRGGDKQKIEDYSYSYEIKSSPR